MGELTNSEERGLPRDDESRGVPVAGNPSRLEVPDRLGIRSSGSGSSLFVVVDDGVSTAISRFQAMGVGMPTFALRVRGDSAKETAEALKTVPRTSGQPELNGHVRPESAREAYTAKMQHTAGD